MEKRTRNGTDLEVSRVCIGTMTFGFQVGESEAAAMMDYCLGQGIHFIDSAKADEGNFSHLGLGTGFAQRVSELSVFLYQKLTALAEDMR